MKQIFATILKCYFLALLSLTLHFQRMNAARLTSLSLLGMIIQCCLRFSGVAILSERFSSTSCDWAGPGGTLVFSVVMSILIGDCRLIPANLSTPRNEMMLF